MSRPHRGQRPGDAGGEVRGHLAGQPPPGLRLAAREHQQRLDQRVGALGRVADHRGHAPVLGDVGVRVGQRHVDFGTHHGERRSQFVRGVGDEALLALEGCADAVEHRVECGCQLGHLVVGADVADALVQRLARQMLGGGGDLLQRA